MKLFELNIFQYSCHFIHKRARPIQKLCEFEGNIPDEYEPDCYKDVDESDYACKEKYRIMVNKNSMSTTISLNTIKHHNNYRHIKEDIV